MHKSFETPCGAYAHFKLTRYLLRITRDARYGDSMERVLYNTVLGATPLQPDGHAFYYSDYTREAVKSFHPDRWPCCSGTLPMIAADYSISSCFTEREGIYVNLYVPALVSWQQGGNRCSLRIDTEYPYEGLVRMDARTAGRATLDGQSAHTGVGQWREPRGQRQARAARLAARNLRRAAAHLASGRSHRIGIAAADASRAGRCRAPRYRRLALRSLGLDAIAR